MHTKAGKEADEVLKDVDAGGSRRQGRDVVEDSQELHQGGWTNAAKEGMEMAADAQGLLCGGLVANRGDAVHRSWFAVADTDAVAHRSGQPEVQLEAAADAAAPDTEVESTEGAGPGGDVSAAACSRKAEPV